MCILTKFSLISLIGICAFMPKPVRAQLTVTDSLPVTDLAQLLEGTNLSISNVQVDCAGAALGYFVGSSELGMPQGLVLTTGLASAVAGPVSGFANNMMNMPGDPDLTDACGSPTWDACVLQFDCIPFGDTLLFNFAFGSEEYPEFVGTSFNDVFAIYLSGPDQPIPVNVAQLPDGTPVSINNVNSQVNSLYFHDNEASFGQNLAYDGFTENLTAFAVVHPGMNYHFKVAIADAGDMVFDSGVFLEAFSFRSVFGSTGLSEMGSPRLTYSRNGDVMNVSLPSRERSARLVFVDALGRTVNQLVVQGKEASVDLSNWAPGAYMMFIENDPALPPVRFVKE